MSTPSLDFYQYARLSAELRTSIGYIGAAPNPSPPPDFVTGMNSPVTVIGNYYTTQILYNSPGKINGPIATDDNVYWDPSMTIPIGAPVITTLVVPDQAHGVTGTSTFTYSKLNSKYNTTTQNMVIKIWKEGAVILPANVVVNCGGVITMTAMYDGSIQGIVPKELAIGATITFTTNFTAAMSISIQVKFIDSNGYTIMSATDTADVS